jgi:hypothetical protein
MVCDFAGYFCGAFLLQFIRWREGNGVTGRKSGKKLGGEGSDKKYNLLTPGVGPEDAKLV